MKGKRLFIIIAVIILLVGSFITYRILNKVEIKSAKEIKMYLEQPISSELNDYGTFIKDKNCQLDTSKVNINKIGTYKYYINCKKTKYIGNIIVSDIKFPEVKLYKEITRPINATIEAEEFVEECRDQTKCTIVFRNEFLLRENVKKVGTYDVDIHIFDEGRNVVNVVGKLVIKNEVNNNLVCQKVYKSENIKNANILKKTTIGFDDNNNYGYVSYEEYIYKLNEKDFNEYIKTIDKDTEKFDDIYGEIIIDEKEKNITVKELVYLSQLKTYVKELNHNNLQQYYHGNGYECIYNKG